MSAKKSKATPYRISNIQINNHFISWENHVLRTSKITRAWIDGRPAEPFPAKLMLVLLFITLSSQHLISIFIMSALLAIGSGIWICACRSGNAASRVYIGMQSGEILSFTADDEASITQFYEVLKQLAGGDVASEIVFDENGMIVEEPDEEVVETEPVVQGISTIGPSQNPLMNELKRLYQSYEKKSDADSEILLLISDTAKLVESGNREEQKTALKRFVTQGLIGDCNELRLDLLIQEIKNSLY